MTEALQPSGVEVSIGGRRLDRLFVAEQAVGVRDDGGDFPEGAERGRLGDGTPWVKVGTDAVEQTWNRFVYARLDGQVVRLVRVLDGRVGVQVDDDVDGTWAESCGLSHDARERVWHGSVPADLLQHVEVVRHVKRRG